MPLTSFSSLRRGFRAFILAQIPTEFYLFCLGRHMNYRCADAVEYADTNTARMSERRSQLRAHPLLRSAGLYREFDPRTGLDNAEAAMLALSCARCAHRAGRTLLPIGGGRHGTTEMTGHRRLAGRGWRTARTFWTWGVDGVLWRSSRCVENQSRTAAAESLRSLSSWLSTLLWQ